MKKDERITFRVDPNEKEEINLLADKNKMNVSEFVYQAIKEKMQTDKLTDSQAKLLNIFDVGLKKSFDMYFKQLMLVMNRIDFNTRWLLKQQDIFMQHLKIPQTKEELIVSVVPHPITEKAEEMVLKDLRKMSANKNEVDDDEE